MMRHRISGRRSIPARTAMYLVLIVTALAVIGPLLIIASSAFKNEGEIFTYPMTLVPRVPVLSNFIQLEAHFPLYIWNSVKVTTAIVVLQFVTATTGAYAFSKLTWRFRDTLFILYIASIMIPIQSIIIPQFIIVRILGLYNTQTALVLVSAFTAFGVFLCRQFFLTIPDSLLEAARIDGASEYRIFFGIVLPLSTPVIVTVIIFSFRYFWNDFFTPLIYLTSQSLKTLPLGMADFVDQYNIAYGPQMAAALISIVPVLIVFLIGQRYFVEGVVATGIKG
ncbi:MAG TPA: carbohydrate ABC transporter permease [Spirochaetia bacterium]|nr:carbohydrate ABC transporter permease [Spirochaetia bacterium]